MPLISGCAFTERSEQAYCGKYREGLEQIVADHPELDPDTAGGRDPLAALISAASAWGDVVALTGELAEVAPDEIRTSVERVHDTLQKQLDAVPAGPAVARQSGAELRWRRGDGSAN